MSPRLLASLAVPVAACQLFAAPIEHNYDLKNVLWKVSVDPVGHSIKGDVTDTLTLASDAATVQLHEGNLAISKVNVNGVGTKFEVAGDVMTIRLPKRGHQGQVLAVRVVYTATPHRGLYFVDAKDAFPSKTGMVYSQGEGEDNRYWVPTYDLPDDKATSECYITVPAKWTAVSNGVLVDTASAGKTKTFHWKMDQPFATYLISIVAGEYVKTTSEWHGIPVSYYVPPGLQDAGRRSFASTPKMIDLYSRLTGVPYPYKKFSQEVVGDFVVGGMENITAVTQMIRTLHASTAEPLYDSTGLVAHELAHQWFGDLITCRTWEHMWLNEGFATVMPVFLDRDWHGENTFDIDRYGNFEGAIDSIGSRNRKAVSGKVGDQPQVGMGSPYPGGASRILMLMHKLGEHTFWEGIKRFLETYKFKPATTPEFFEVLSRISGQDLTEFQSQWFHTSATPSLSMKIDGADLVVTQLAPYYTLDIPVWVLDSGDWVKKSIHVEGETSKLALGDLAGKPSLLDPEVWTVMELRDERPMSADELFQLYTHAPNCAQKARLIATAFDRIPVPDRIAVARRESEPGLLTMIAGHMGLEGRSYLLELTRHPDVRVVNAAVAALGAMEQDAVTRSTLSAIASKSPNELLREHAMQALLDQSSDPDLAAKAWTTKAFDDGYRVMALGWWAKHAPDTARVHALKALADEDNLPVRMAACQALGAVKEGPDGHSVLNALAREALGTSYRPKIFAIQALGSLGDKATLPVLAKIPSDAAGGVLGARDAAVKALGG